MQIILFLKIYPKGKKKEDKNILSEKLSISNIIFDTEKIYMSNSSWRLTDIEHKFVVPKVWVWGGVGDQQIQTIIYRMDNQQDPPVQHRKIYLISHDKPQWKRI